MKTQMIKNKTKSMYVADLFTATITPSEQDGVIAIYDIEITKHTILKGIKCLGVELSSNGKYNTIARWQCSKDNIVSSNNISLSKDIIEYLEPFAKWAATQAHIDSKIKVQPEKVETKKNKTPSNDGYKQNKPYKRFYKKGFKKSGFRKFFKKKNNPFALSNA